MFNIYSVYRHIYGHRTVLQLSPPFRTTLKIGPIMTLHPAFRIQTACGLYVRSSFLHVLCVP